MGALTLHLYPRRLKNVKNEKVLLSAHPFRLHFTSIYTSVRTMCERDDFSGKLFLLDNLEIGLICIYVYVLVLMMRSTSLFNCRFLLFLCHILQLILVFVYRGYLTYLYVFIMCQLVLFLNKIFDIEFQVT